MEEKKEKALLVGLNITSTARKIDDIDINNPHAIIEMRKRVMQNAALSIALMKILDTRKIPTDKCDIPSNLPQYDINNEVGENNE